MADQTDDEQRLVLEEFQRQQAEKAVQSSQNQPNAIPNEPVRAADYARQPSIVGDPSNPQGFFIDRGGANLGPTGQVPLSSAVGIQGVLSPEEQRFWTANPMGAVPHPQTGELLGLGSDESSRQKALQDISPPEQLAAGTLPAPNFLQVPIVDPAIPSRMSEVQNEIAQLQNDLRGASNQPLGRGMPSQAQQIGQKIDRLSHIYNGLTQNHLAQVAANRHAVDSNTKMQNEYNVQRDATAATIALGRIKAEPGTDEYKAAATKILLNDYPNAMRDQKMQKHAFDISTYHDARAESIKRAVDAGQLVKVKGYGQKGETVQYLTPSEFKTQQMDEINKSLKSRGIPFGAQGLFNPVGEGHQVVDNKYANVPYSQLPPDASINVPYNDAKGELKSIPISKGRLDELKNEFNQQYKQGGGVFPSLPQPTATPRNVDASKGVSNYQTPQAQTLVNQVNASLDKMSGPNREPMSVTMQSPDGKMQREVPLALVDYYKRQGATIVGQ